VNLRGNTQRTEKGKQYGRDSKSETRRSTGTEALGFRCVRSEATFVRFESRAVSINVYHGRQSYEIGLEIEFASAREAYSFSELLRLVDPEQAERYRNYATHTVQGVAEGVGQLADLFHRCIDAGILDDSQLVPHLKLQREELSRNYAFKTQLQQARRISEAAWRKRNYADVVKALKPFRAALTPSEVRKLELGRRKDYGVSHRDTNRPRCTHHKECSRHMTSSSCRR
jgi:hypothetical protein